MKKILVSLCLLSIFVFGLLNIDLSGTAYYNSTLHYIVCKKGDDCLHEIGHAIDDSMGWPSQSKEYSREVREFISSNIPLPDAAREPFTYEVVGFPGVIRPLNKQDAGISTSTFWLGGWGGYTELYADMFRWAEGKPENMPSGFLKFYNWTLAKQLISRYVIYP